MVRQKDNKAVENGLRKIIKREWNKGFESIRYAIKHRVDVKTYAQISREEGCSESYIRDRLADIRRIRNYSGTEMIDLYNRNEITTAEIVEGSKQAKAEAKGTTYTPKGKGNWQGPLHSSINMCHSVNEMTHYPAELFSYVDQSPGISMVEFIANIQKEIVKWSK